MTEPFEWSEDEEVGALQRYEGLPIKLERSGEKTAWKKFLTWMLPWLRRKRELADEYLEAEVLDKKATALAKLAEAELKFAEARRTAAETAEIAAKLDEMKSKQYTIASAEAERTGLNLEQLEALRDELERKLAVLRTLHGGSISVSEEEGAHASYPPASTSSAQDE